MREIVIFKDELTSIKRGCEHGSFEYGDPNISFSSVVSSHFQTVPRNDRHGVYIVRQKSTGEVLYIGKSGTINRHGQFKGQDIPGRLKNVKNSDTSANEWFRSLFEEKLPLIVE